jgi:hypothetical protein
MAIEIVYTMSEEQRDALLSFLKGEDLETSEVLEFVKLVDTLKGEGEEYSTDSDDSDDSEESNEDSVPVINPEFN